MSDYSRFYIRNRFLRRCAIVLFLPVMVYHYFFEDRSIRLAIADQWHEMVDFIKSAWSR